MRPTPPSIPHTISRYAYAELRAFCRQYGEKKSRAAALAGVSSPILTGMPHGSDISDPVTRAAERREKAACRLCHDRARSGTCRRRRLLSRTDSQLLPRHRVSLHGSRYTTHRKPQRLFPGTAGILLAVASVQKRRNLILFFDGFVLKWHREKRNRPVGRSAKAPRSFLYKKSREVVNMDGR